MVDQYQYIIDQLPYSSPFLFVDEIISIDDNGVEAAYTFDADHSFYQGHFKDNPVTPGVILSETMAQAGVVCLGIWLLKDVNKKEVSIVLTSMDCEYLKPVFPGEKVTVRSVKKYFRFGKLKCDVNMVNANGETVCTGTIAGMMTGKL